MWSYPHLVQYYKVVRGQRVLAFHEEIDDQGFYVGRTEYRQAGTTALEYLVALTVYWREEYGSLYGISAKDRVVARAWSLSGREKRLIAEVVVQGRPAQEQPAQEQPASE
ncbi:hypothetical protein [Streptoalloteichus hindustanus]|uniref:Uncharacterized protein n=1 Tax=Streptoalloteichus hindustanus TaxID=2017 RepID=A0A1M4W7S2_STRHI|nr:hypothetical protein [Streptoalloteichus hindustanus]SHE77311.1 hypothetical protein SAMN05444320_1011039 [Streptoalloteichus hindustanus]